jgi:ribosomal protein S18 acetylase RimI-like enzyme
MPPIQQPFSVRPLARDEVSGRLLPDVVWVFGAALGFARRSSRVVSFADTVQRHAGYPGFTAFGAFHQRGRLVGFSYGYASQPGLWWREQVCAALSPEQRDDWFADAFELAELHVHPSAQGHRLGSQLHDRLIESQSHHRTALLSVMHRSDRARRLYASRGWQPVVEDLRFSTEPGTPFSLLGLRLDQSSSG